MSAGQEKSADGQASANAVYHLAFTWNLWDAGEARPPAPSIDEFGLRHVELATFLRKHGDFIFQHEYATRHHYQGYIHLTKRKARASTFQALMYTQFFGIQVRAASEAGRAALSQYCMKADTRVAGPWHSQQPVILTTAEKKELCLIDEQRFHPWQHELKQKITEEKLDTPLINVLIEPTGGAGKSAFGKFMHANGYATYVPGIQKAADLAFLCYKKEGTCYIFDVFRSKPAEVSNTDVYSVIEGLRAGSFTTSKYTPDIACRKPSLVWVFTNRAPPLHALSAHRWKCWRIDGQQHLVPISLKEVSSISDAEYVDHCAREIVRSKRKQRLENKIQEKVSQLENE